MRISYIFEETNCYLHQHLAVWDRPIITSAMQYVEMEELFIISWPL
jgi:hypothetical protein